MSNETFYRLLLAQDKQAIQRLKTLILPKVTMYCKKFSVPSEAAEEVTHDSMLILMDDMLSGKYTYEGKDPAIYGIKVGQYLVLNLSKSKYTRKDKVQDLTAAFEFVGLDNIEKRLHEVHLLDQLLAQVQDRCQQLIKLKYLMEYSYEQMIELNLTHYQSVAALKNATSQCMAKLTEVAKKSGLTNI